MDSPAADRKSDASVRGSIVRRLPKRPHPAAAALSFLISLLVLTASPAASAASLSFSPLKGLTFSDSNGTLPGPQNLSVVLAGTGSLAWSAATDKTWITVTPASGSGSATLQVSVNPAGLSPTSYLGHIIISAPGASPATQTVNVSLSVASPTLTFNTKEVNVSIPSSGQASATFNLTNTGGAQLAWTAISNTAWLQVSPTSGSAPAQIVLSANLAGYPPGTYRGSAVVTAHGASGSPATLVVNATVSSRPPVLQLGSSGLSFTMTSGGSAPSAQSFSINDSPATSASWTAQASQSWIVLGAASGTMPSQLQVSINAASLSAGTYQGSVQVTAAGLTSSPASVPITLTVNPPPPVLQLGSSGLSFTMTSGGSAPSAQSFSINDSPTTSASWTAQASQSWIVLGAASGTMPSQLQVSINAASLSAGTYQGSVQVTADGLTSSPASVPISLTINPTNVFYVSPTGSHSGSGSITDPWDLATALAQPAAVQPGATIWLRGGVYSGTFTSTLVGAPGNPIVVRQYPGERATIDSGTSNNVAALIAQGSDTWFWGFEIMSSNPNRYDPNPGSCCLPDRVDGIDAFGVRNKYINLIVHDTAQGFGFWTPAMDSEIYGCVVYYNGWFAPDRGHGHGIYVQNQNGVKLIRDNIQFYGFGMGFHAYGTSNAFVQNIHFDGNISYDSGYLVGGPPGHWANYLVTGGSGASGIVFTNNHSYHNTGDVSGTAELGWSFSSTELDLDAENNYFVGGLTTVELWNWNQLTFTGNTVYSIPTSILDILNLTSAQTTATYNFDHNNYYGRGLLRYQGSNVPWIYWQNTSGVDLNSQFSSGRPTGVWTTIRPNLYEPGRANIIIYNWDLNGSVSVDVSSVLSPGQQYTVQDAMNYFGPPVASGVYDGTPIVIPMAGLTLAPPIGSNIPYQPVHTAPEFGVFVLLGM